MQESGEPMELGIFDFYIVKDIIYLTYILNTLRSLRCMILVTAKSAKSAKIV
jgi:hypothetical protein